MNRSNLCASKGVYAAVVLMALAFSLPASAGRLKGAPKVLPPFPVIANETPVNISDELRAELIERATKRRSSDRSPAATMSANVTKYIAEPLQGAKTPEALDLVLADMTPGSKKWNEEYKTADVKYFAAQISLLRPLRSIVYRLRPLAEEHNKSVQSVAVSALKSIAANTTLYLPNEHWKAGFDYITQPSGKISDPTNVQFRSVAQLQGALVGYIEAIRAAFNVIEPMYLTKVVSSTDGFIWDKSAAYGAENYSAEDRYAIHYEAEVTAALSAMKLAIHSIYAFASYDLENMMEYYEDIGKLTGMDGFGKLGSIIRDGDFGVSAGNRYSVLMDLKLEDRNFTKKRDDSQRSWKYKYYLTRWTDPVAWKKGKRQETAGYMGNAWTALRDGIKYLDLSWGSMRQGENKVEAIMNPIIFAGGRREGDARIRKLLELTQDHAKDVELKSIVTGDAATVNLYNFYHQPPEDVKALAAIEYDTGPLEKGTPPLTYRNYYRGQPKAWNTSPTVWGRYVKNDQPGRAMRILQQSFGGDYLSPLMDSVVW